LVRREDLEADDVMRMDVDERIGTRARSVEQPESRDGKPDSEPAKIR